MEITTREHLHQVDLLSPAPIKITEREYWKTRREQEKLDTLNTRIIADGMKPRITAICAARRPLVRLPAATRRSPTATFIKVFR